MPNELATPDRDVDYWATDREAEALLHSTVDEAMAEWWEYNEHRPNRPESVTVYGWTRQTITPKMVTRLAERILDDAIEHMDEGEELNNGDQGTEVTDAMKAAAQTFAEAFAAEYVPWCCEQVTERPIIVAEWLARSVVPSSNTTLIVSPVLEDSP